jgi:hypothetical protein
MTKSNKQAALLALLFCSVATGVSAQTGGAGTAVPYPATSRGPVETPLNTITTTGPDGARYKLVLVGDLVPQFYINDKAQDSIGRRRHAALIGELEPLLWERQRQAGLAKDAETLRQQEAISDELVKSQVIESKKDLLSFRLSASELVVNGQKQSFSLFEHFRAKYILDNDLIFQYNQRP